MTSWQIRPVSSDPKTYIRVEISNEIRAQQASVRLFLFTQQNYAKSVLCRVIFYVYLYFKVTPRTIKVWPWSCIAGVVKGAVVDQIIL